MILECRKAYHKVALASEDLCEVHANRAKRSGLFLKAKAIHIGGDAANAAAVGRNSVTGALHITVTALPHHDLARLDASLLQPLTDSQRQRQMGCDGLAAKAVNLEADDLADRNNALPRLNRLVAAGVCGDGAVQQIDHALFVQVSSGRADRKSTRL